MQSDICLYKNVLIRTSKRISEILFSTENRLPLTGNTESLGDLLRRDRRSTMSLSVAIKNNTAQATLLKI